MPLYEYQCDACGGRIERIRKFSDPPLDEPCPTCGGHLTKLLSSPAIQFKGSGWYITDYARKGGSGGTNAATDAKPAGSGGGEAAAKTGGEGKPGSESKPATATESKPATGKE